MRDLLAQLATSLPYVLTVMVVVVAVALLVVWLMVRRARHAPWAAAAVASGASGAAGAPGGASGQGWWGRTIGDLRLWLGSSSLRRSFAAARRDLTGSGATRRGGAYSLPWCLLIGQASAGKSTLAALCGLDLPFGEPQAGAGGEAPCRVWRYGDGVVIDVAGDLVLRRDGRTSDEDAWRAVLRLLAGERRRRPLDGVVLTLPVTALRGRDGGAAGGGGSVADGGGSGTGAAGAAGGAASASGSAGGAGSDAGAGGIAAGGGAALWSSQAQSQSLNDAAQRAAILCRKLSQLQSAIGMRLPVYIVVTDSDLLPGFSAFRDLLRPAALGQMFGWSSPDSPDTAYSPSWVDRCFAQILDRLDTDLAEVLGSRATTDGNAEAFEVVHSVGGLREPVRVYLNQIFSASAAHEAFPLRGVYFTGARFAALDWQNDSAVVPRGAQPVPAGGAHGDQRPSAIDFARDLLAAKVFPEAPLGRPTAAALRADRWRRLWLQASLAVVLLAAAVGLPAAWHATVEHVAVLTPFYAEIQRDLEDLEALVPGGGMQTMGPGTTQGPVAGTAADPRAPAARRLIAYAGQLDDYSLRNLLLPASWLSPLDAEQRRAAARAYEGITLPAIRTALDGRLGGLGANTGSPSQTVDAVPRAYAQTAEFQRLAGFVADLSAVETRVGTFNCIAEGCTHSASELVGDLDQLTRWAFDQGFHPPSWDAVGFYGAVLRRSTVPALAYPPAGNDFGLRRSVQALGGAFDQRLFEYNAVVGDLDALDGELRRLGGGAAVSGAAAYRRLYDLIVKTQQDLGAPEVAWMGAPRLALGSPYDPLLTAVGGLHFLGPQAAADLRSAGDTGFGQMKTRLANYTSPYTGPFLAQQDGQVQLKLGAGVVQLEQALRGLLGQGFMTPLAAWPVYPPGGQGVLLWDANLLQQAQAQALPLQDFLKQGLTLFPVAMQSQVAQLASTSTRDQMVTTIGNAAHWQARPTWRVPELLQASLDRQVASFQAAAPVLGPLITSFNAMGFPADAAQLSAQVDRERRGILEQLGVLLALDNLYSTGDPSFSWWDGKAGLAYGAFGVADAASLGAYLDSQRQIVTNLADRYASPVLAASGALPALDGGVAARWRTVLADLDAYKAKLAGNPLQTLETLISPTLVDVTVGTCQSQVQAAGSRLSADYFLGRRDELANGVANRCLVLLRTDARGAYVRLAAIFNRSLAGRFPFTDGKPPRQEPMAETPAIAGFYAAYDASQALIAQAPRGDDVFLGRYDQVQAFMARMKAVRPLFAPYLDTPQQYPVPTLGFNVEFRVNRAAEQGANEIFLWRLTIGDVALDLGGATASGRWSYAQPATLTLAWAQNSPNIPLAVDNSHWASVDARTATYAYTTPWGLLALLRDNPAAAEDFQHPEDVDDRAQTLKFTLVTRHDPPLPLPETKQAVAFVRITLTTPDGKTQLALPRFPTHAPTLGD